jgi:hypothetical protein
MPIVVSRVDNHYRRRGCLHIYTAIIATVLSDDNNNVLLKMRESNFLSGMIDEYDDDDDELKYAIPLSPHSLQGLECNDYPFAMAGLSVSGSDWIDRAEHVIGDHTSLRSIHIDMTMTESYRVPGFFIC